MPLHEHTEILMDKDFSLFKAKPSPMDEAFRHNIFQSYDLPLISAATSNKLSFTAVAEHYYPNLCSRQFELVQSIPYPIIWTINQPWDEQLDNL